MTACRPRTSLGRVRISRAQRDDLLAHAREEAPNECCGYLPLREGVVESVQRAENVRRSPYGYELDHKSLLAANELEDDGYEVAVYHSHPRSPAEPSQTDINLAQYPNWLYVIVSPADELGVRAWQIADGTVREEEVEVEP
jgi:[CysO sulfur-carrier protein]-S-L-cysteine hydrolase